MTQIGAINVKISADDAGFQAATKRTVASAAQTATAVQVAGKNMGRYSLAASGAAKATGGLGRISQQAGYQLQDFIVQVQGGQSAFVAFGQQGSQLAGIFGPGGAVLGAVIALSAAIGGTLVKAMAAAGQKVKELPEELLKRLEQIKAAYAEVDESSQQAFSQVALGKLGTEISAVTAKTNALRDANATLGEQIQKTSDPRTVKQYEQQIASNERAIKGLNSEQADLINLQNQVSGALLSGMGEWQEYEEVTGKADDAILKLSQQLSVSEMQLRSGELAARLFAAALATGAASSEELDPALKQQIQTIYSLEQAQIAAVESSKAMQDQEKLARTEMIAGMKEEMAKRQEFQKLQAELDALNNPVEKARQQLAERLEVIMEYYGLENEAQALQYEAGQQAYQAHQDLLNTIESKAADDKLALNQRTENAIQSMRQTAIGSAINLLDQFAGQSKVAALASIALSKGLALAQNAQNTLVAQTRALAELGPVLGPPAAAKIGLYGKINAGLIAATGLAQAGNVGKAGAQVFSGGVPAMNTTGGGGAGPSRNISISLSGSSFGAGGIRDLIAQINEAVGDGVALNVTGG